MRNLYQKAIGLTAGGIVAVGLATNASAVNIGVDVVLADDPGITTADARVEMSISGDTLTISVVNLLSGGPGGAGGLLTGLAFSMPAGIDILSGSVGVLGGSFIRGGVLNGAGAGTDVSGEYGFLNGISGHFNDASLSTDTQVSAMQADSATKFSATPIESPTVLDGPEFGLLGTGEDRGGLTAIENGILITLKLSADPSGPWTDEKFLSAIEKGTVAVTYGSPTGGTTSVPDAGSTLAMMGLAMTALAGIRRKFSSR